MNPTRPDIPETNLKITKGLVYDPRGASTFRDPDLIIEVDGPVVEMGDPIYLPHSAQYRVIPCGAFFAVEFRAVAGLTPSIGPWVDYAERGDADIGVVNTSRVIRHQLVPVVVHTPEEVLDLFMLVPRARRMLRRYSGSDTYEIIVDEEAAMLGSLQWRVELSERVCYGGDVPGSAHCRQRPTQTIVHRSTHLTLCADHLKAHSDRMRDNRIKS